MRIAFSIDPEGTISAALWRKRLAARIDRAIKAAVKAEHHRMYDIGWRVSHMDLSGEEIHEQLSAKPAKKTKGGK